METDPGVPVPPPATQNFGFNPNLAPVAILPMLLDSITGLMEVPADVAMLEIGRSRGERKP